MDAVVLAGGAMPAGLALTSGASERALIKVGGTTILDHVLGSLRACDGVDGLIVVTTPEALQHLDAEVVGVSSGSSLVQNLMRGVERVQSDEVLIVTGDIPLVRASTWESFLGAARSRGAQACYPIVRRERCIEQFPSGRRTYATLLDGTFTGGNAFIMPRAALEPLRSLIEAAFAARKNPLRLAAMLGPGLILKALLRRLRIAEVEQKMSKLLGCSVAALEMDDAAIAFDVDKPSDLTAVEQQFGEWAKVDECGPARMQTP